jgi:hypothetical protein
MGSVKKNDWADFEHEAKALSIKGSGARCSIAVLLDTLPVDAVDTVATAIDNPNLTAHSVSRALEKRLGADAPSGRTIARHRRRECSCRREG